MLIRLANNNIDHNTRTLDGNDIHGGTIPVIIRGTKPLTCAFVGPRSRLGARS